MHGNLQLVPFLHECTRACRVRAEIGQQHQVQMVVPVGLVLRTNGHSRARPDMQRDVDKRTRERRLCTYSQNTKNARTRKPSWARATPPHSISKGRKCCTNTSLRSDGRTCERCHLVSGQCDERFHCIEALGLPAARAAGRGASHATRRRTAVCLPTTLIGVRRQRASAKPGGRGARTSHLVGGHAQAEQRLQQRPPQLQQRAAVRVAGRQTHDHAQRLHARTHAGDRAAHALWPARTSCLTSARWSRKKPGSSCRSSVEASICALFRNRLQCGHGRDAAGLRLPVRSSQNPPPAEPHSNSTAYFAYYCA